MGISEIINTLKQYPWQVHVGMLSLIPLYIIDIKFFMKKKVGLEKKIEIAKERGHVTRGTIDKKDAHKLITNQSHSDYSYLGAYYTYTVNDKNYHQKFSADPRNHTRSPLRTIINVYWIDNPNRPFWDYSSNSLGHWYDMLTVFGPIIIAIIIVLLLGGGDAILQYKLNGGV